MFRGNAMSDAGINVYIGERGGDGDEDGPFKKQLESEFAAPFRFVSVGRGAAAAGWVAELVSFAENYGAYVVGVVIAGFFAGERIEKNLDAWPRLYQRLKSTFHRRPIFDREGAAVLIMNEITQQLGDQPTSIQCRGFEVIDRVASGNPLEIPEPMPLNVIGPRQSDRVSFRDVYYFDVEANGRRFLGRVDGNEVVVKEVDNPRG